MYAPHLREMIEDVLMAMESSAGVPYSKDAVELLMLTAAQESHLGYYLKQIKGPARGIFQIEPETEKDLLQYMKKKPALKKFTKAYHPDMMQFDLGYQILMARIFYWRFKEPLPSHDDVMGMAKYWKKYYNTHLGKGTPEEAYNNYYKLVLDKLPPIKNSS